MWTKYYLHWLLVHCFYCIKLNLTERWVFIVFWPLSFYPEPFCYQGPSLQERHRNLCLALVLFPPANSLLSFKDILSHFLWISLARVLILDDALFEKWFEHRDICIFIANYSLSKGFCFSFISSSRIFKYWHIYVGIWNQNGLWSQSHLCKNLASPHMRLSETSLSCELVMLTYLIGLIVTCM